MLLGITTQRKVGNCQRKLDQTQRKASGMSVLSTRVKNSSFPVLSIQDHHIAVFMTMAMRVRGSRLFTVRRKLGMRGVLR